MATKTHPYGTRLSYSVNDVSYTNIADVKSVTPPAVGVGPAESSTLDQADAAREYIAGLIEGGELAFTLRFGKTVFNTLYGFLRLTYWWKTTFPLIDSETNGSVFKCQGFITSIGFDEMSIEGDECVSVPITIKVTGKPTFTAGS